MGQGACDSVQHSAQNYAYWGDLMMQSVIVPNYKIMLQRAFAHGHTSPDNDIYAKPKNTVKRTRKRKVIRDKDGNIKEINATVVSGTQTRTTKINTTESAAMASIYGKVLGAALAQPRIYADMMQLVYNPLCKPDVAIRAIWSVVMRLNGYVMQLSSAKQYRLTRCLPMLISDEAHSIRGGFARLTDADVCRLLGYTDNKNYYRVWARIIEHVRAEAREMEHLASRTVKCVVSEMLTELDDVNGIY